ncbi:uncharacterized protein [Anabrus simplex]
MGFAAPPRIFKVFSLILVWCLFLGLGFQLFYHRPVFIQNNVIDTSVKTPVADFQIGTVNSELLEETIKNESNLPIAFWEKVHVKKNMFYKNSSCSPLPNILELEYNNIHWQTVNTTNGTFYLLSAYYDDREMNPLKATVRIIGMINRVDPQVSTTCQLWFEDRNEPVFSKIEEYKYIWHLKWGGITQGTNQPYLMTCKVPADMKGKIPVAVSVVENKCDKAQNILKVRYSTPPEKKDFVVCVKGLDFLHKDLSVRLVEWIELLGILGADKVVLYELQAHPNISRILRYYENTHQVEVIPLTLPGKHPNAPFLQHMYLTNKLTEKRKHEVIPYNDCFYRNMNSYRFVVLLDIDEVIMPKSMSSWRELIEHVNTTKKASCYYARNVYFLDDLQHSHGWFLDIPQHLHMLQHVYRTKNYTRPGHFVKSFHNTEIVKTLHNHFPMSCLTSCFNVAINESDAQLQHYRADCVGGLKKVCQDYRKDVVVDTSIWKFKEELIKRTTNTFQKLGIIP